MNDLEKTSHHLDSLAPRLHADQKAALWSAIDAKRIAATPQPTPFLFSFITTRPMAPIALAVLLMIGVSGTAVAADHARPGDALFSLDRGMEQARLSLATNAETKIKIEQRMADERLAELESILQEKAEAKTEAKAAKAEAKTQVAVDVITDTMADSSLDSEIRTRLGARLSELLVNADIRIDGDRVRIESEDGNTRVEVDGDGETRVRVDGDTRVDIRGNGILDLGGLLGGDDDSDDDSVTTTVSYEAEADVFTDTTVVTVEINDRKSSFTTLAKSKADIAAEISRRYDITTAQAEGNLDIEIENRTSRSTDIEVRAEGGGSASVDFDQTIESSHNSSVNLGL